MKLFAGLLIGASMLIASVAMAAPYINTANTANGEASVGVNVIQDAYAYFVTNTLGAPADANPNPIGGGAAVNGTSAVWGPTASRAEDFTTMLGADGKFDITIKGNFATNSACGADTEYMAYGANTTGFTADYVLDMNAVGGKRIGDGTQGYGSWYLAVDGQADDANLLKPDASNKATVQLGPINQDLVSRVKLSLVGVGEEVPSGAYSGKLTLTVMTP